MTSKTLPETLEELNDIHKFLMKAEKTIKEGGHVDMTGLDERINGLCDNVQNASEPQKKVFYLNEMKKLLKKLDKCMATIKEAQHKLNSSK